MEPIYFAIGETDWRIERTNTGSWLATCEALDLEEEADIFEDVISQIMDTIRTNIEEALEDLF